MIKKRIGRIVVPPGVFIDIHEKKTVDFLAINLHLDITFLLPIRHSGTKTPDIEMSGLKWEIKSPTGKSSRTIENNVRNALRQSVYIILDLRRMDGRVPTYKFLNEIERQFNQTKNIKTVIVITREENIIDFKR